MTVLAQSSLLDFDCCHEFWSVDNHYHTIVCPLIALMGLTRCTGQSDYSVYTAEHKRDLHTGLEV